MRKNALTVTVATLIVGIFGAFLRWLQMMNIYDRETNLTEQGASISHVLVLYCAAVAVFAVLGTLVLLRHYERPEKGEDAFRCATILPALLGWVCCAVYALCGVSLMFSAGEFELPLMQRLLGAGCIAAGVFFPVLPCRRSYENVSVIGRRAASGYLALFFCLFLIYGYRANAENPALWTYGPEILAIAVTTLAFYRVAGWFFDRKGSLLGFVYITVGAVLDILVLADSDRDMNVQALFAAAAVMLLLLQFLLVANLREKTEK